MPAPTPTLDELRSIAESAGLHALGLTTADPFEGTRVILEERRQAGLAGSMQFTYRNPARSTDPARALPGVATLVVGARSYHRDAPPPPDGVGPVGRVARYVWADDQEILLAGLEAVAERLREAGYRATVSSDQNHLVDRAAARRAGLGWYGKNANLLLPGRGSWFLLGAVLTDAPVAAEQDDLPADGCGPCVRCIDACPTGAIIAPGVVDARRCLSWTLQATGIFPVDQREALGDRIYGCDDCQEVCPPNRREELRAAPGGRGRPVPLGDPRRAWVPLLDLLRSDDQELLERHGRWYIARRDPRHLRRNALVVLGNVADGTDPEVRHELARALADPDPMLRAHAVWSARRLGCDDLVMAVHDDPDPDVQAELERPVPRAEPPHGSGPVPPTHLSGRSEAESR